MSPDSARLRPDDAHDILAAEEFGVPAPDPDPHDVLAAEEFPVPAGHEDHRHDKLARVVVPGLGPRLAARGSRLAVAGLTVAVATVLHRRRK